MLMYTTLRQMGLGGFANIFYWSSTETGSGSAWYQVSPMATSSPQTFKNNTLSVRAVRAF
jgi:hypothetical protein